VTLVTRSIAVVLAVFVMLGAGVAGASHLKEQPRKHRVVYHLTEAGADKAKAVLGNIVNHVSGVGGWENIEALEFVVHGPALRMFVTTDIDPAVRGLLDRLQTQGLALGACGNTMKGMNITLEQLPDGTKRLPQGGVVRVMELQEAGYSYVRP
jgi:intracellular sulfur oxidation DsrE/DsrF family protein